MTFLNHLKTRTWIFVVVLACGYLMWTASVRIARIEQLTGAAGGSEVRLDANSPTGREGGKRVLIVPGPFAESYQWIAQTQQMIAGGEWRLRRVNYDNAPFGREVLTASPYRWWLGLVAWVDHMITGRPTLASVEHAALYADLALQLLLLAAAAFAVHRWFGSVAAILISVGWAGLYPLGGGFQPGVPLDYGLSLAAAFWSVVPLLANARGGPTESKTAAGEAAVLRLVRRRFILAGIAGGIGLWINAGVQLPVLFGIAAGAVIAAACGRRGPNEEGTSASAWRYWSSAGALISLGAYLIEFAPSHLLSLRLDYNHPLYAAAWWGVGELVVASSIWLREGRRTWTRALRWRATGGGLAIVALLSALALSDGRGVWFAPPLGDRLIALADSAVAQSALQWIANEKGTLAFWLTLLPVPLLLVPIVLGVVRRSAPPAVRNAAAVAGGAIVVALGFAAVYLSWWQMVDVLLLAALAMLTSDSTRRESRARNSWAIVAGSLLLFVSGSFLLAPKAGVRNYEILSEAEIQALIDRDLAHWLANRVGPDGAIVLAPPALTASLIYHGGLRGIGTSYRENQEGFIAAVRLAAASSADEAMALARRRELTHILVPSWDSFLDEYARIGSARPDGTLIALLHRWLPPRWLQPIPYQVPNVAGLEDRSVAIFKMVDVQENAVMLSRLAEYFLEMNQRDNAALVAQALAQSFPDDTSALAARAQVALASRDAREFEARAEALQRLSTRGSDVLVPWDRRVSVAYVLLQSRREDAARSAVQGCLDELDEYNLRSLTTVSLYRFLAMLGRFELSIEDPELHRLALALLPAEMRERL